VKGRTREIPKEKNGIGKNNLLNGMTEQHNGWTNINDVIKSLFAA
jgi:hypothetical protein